MGSLFRTLAPGIGASISSSFILFLAFASTLSLSCSSPKATANHPPASQEITVAAAANLTDAFAEMAQAFTAQTGVRVRLSFGATADLARQIEHNAPYDVFASADVEHVDRLNALGLLMPGQSKLFARGRLVLWIPGGSRFQLARIEDITRPEVERISIAKPDLAPYGRATVEALRALNLWTEIERKVIYGQNVSQAKQYAATGNAEAAFIPLALVKAGEGQMIEVEEHLYQPLNQTIGVVRDSPQPEAAQSFVNFILSPTGQGILERYGYRKVVSER